MSHVARDLHASCNGRRYGSTLAVGRIRAATVDRVPARDSAAQKRLWSEAVRIVRFGKGVGLTVCRDPHSRDHQSPGLQQ